MAKVKFTSALNRFFPTLTDVEIQAATVGEVLQSIEEKFPGISPYILDEHRQLRKHVNIFLKGELIKDRLTLKDTVEPKDELLIFQALSGG